MLKKGASIDGVANPAPYKWGRTTFEEWSESNIGAWPSVTADINPPNAFSPYGGAAFESVMLEFCCAVI